MRKHLLTVSQAANGFIIEVADKITHPDWDKPTTGLSTYVAKTPEEVLSFIQQHSEFAQVQQSLPL